MSFGRTAAAANATAAKKDCDVSKDVEVPQGPSDSISALSWSPASNHLGVSSWDNSIRVYEVNVAGQIAARGVASYSHEAPALDLCWSRDGSKIASGGVDNAARVYDVASGQSMQVGKHDAPIKSTRWTDMHGGLLMTGSWDKTVKYWDLKSPNPIGSLQLPERCYGMDVQGQLAVVITAEKRVHAIDLRNPMAIAESIESPLKFQSRCVAVAPDASSYCIGSIEGRVAVNFTAKPPPIENYTFRCHRVDPPATKTIGTFGKAAETAEDPVIYTVNALAYHPTYGSCTSGGGDGCFISWDIQNKKRLENHSLRNPTMAKNVSLPVCALAYNNPGGNVLAYAVSYDWARGHRGNTPGHVNKVMLHAVSDEEVKLKPSAGRR